MWGLIVSVPDHCLSFYFVIASSPRALGQMIFEISMSNCTSTENNYGPSTNMASVGHSCYRISL